jgi:hypothetical protein
MAIPSVHTRSLLQSGPSLKRPDAGRSTETVKQLFPAKIGREPPEADETKAWTQRDGGKSPSRPQKIRATSSYSLSG